MQTGISEANAAASINFNKEAAERGGLSAISEVFDHQAPVRHVQPDGIIALHGSKADTVYEVVSGTVRCCTISEEGHRQIFRFVRSGDFLGLVDMDSWHYTAEAVDHVIIRSVPRARFDAALMNDAELQDAIRRFVAKELATREHQLVMFAYKTATERLLSFLEAFASSRKTDGFVALPLTRRDIGDHLGLTLETVSRAFSALRKSGVIEMKGTGRFKMTQQGVPIAA